MFDVEQSIFINRPAQDVFEIITDPDRITEWGAATSAKWITDGPPGIGSKRQGTTKLLGRNVTTVSEVTAWDPPHRFDFRSQGNVTGTLSHKIEEKEGGSQLSVSGQVDLGWLRIADPLLKRLVDRRMATDINAIKRILESETK